MILWLFWRILVRNVHSETHCCNNSYSSFQEYLDLQPPLVSPLSPRTPSSSEEDNVFGSSEHVCDFTNSKSDSLNNPNDDRFHHGSEDTEHDGEDGYADIRQHPDDDPLLDFSGSKTSLSSKSSLFAKRSLNQLNGSIASLSSQMSKQMRAMEDKEGGDGEHASLLENDASQGSDEAFETIDNVNPRTGPTISEEPSKSSDGVLETSLDSEEIDPDVLIKYTPPKKPNPPRRPSQQTEV